MISLPIATMIAIGLAAPAVSATIAVHVSYGDSNCNTAMPELVQLSSSAQCTPGNCYAGRRLFCVEGPADSDNYNKIIGSVFGDRPVLVRHDYNNYGPSGDIYENSECTGQPKSYASIADGQCVTRTEHRLIESYKIFTRPDGGVDIHLYRNPGGNYDCAGVPQIVTVPASELNGKCLGANAYHEKQQLLLKANGVNDAAPGSESGSSAQDATLVSVVGLAAATVFALLN